MPFASNAKTINSNINEFDDFVLAATSGKMIKKDQLGQQKSILFFYPKDNTPGCTIEAQDFSANYDLFQQAGYEIYGISRDNIESHDHFKHKQSLPFELISDPEQILCQAFDVIKQKNMFGKTINSLERSTFITDEQGEVIKSWQQVEVKNHVHDVIDFLQLKHPKKAI